MQNRVNPMIQTCKMAISALLIAGLLVTQAFPLSDAQLVAKPESKRKSPAIVAPVAQVSPQITSQTPVTKDPKSMTPLPFCQQSAILSIQAVITGYSLLNDEAIGEAICPTHQTVNKQSVRNLRNSRALVHTGLALQATLVGAHPSGTS